MKNKRSKDEQDGEVLISFRAQDDRLVKAKEMGIDVSVLMRDIIKDHLEPYYVRAVKDLHKKTSEAVKSLK